MEFGILIPGIPLPKKSQKECSLRFLVLDLSFQVAAINNSFEYRLGVMRNSKVNLGMLRLLTGLGFFRTE